MHPVHAGLHHSPAVIASEGLSASWTSLSQANTVQAQFGVGLREAAANLRICPTTLKRACRRHGITRWPRRQLARLHREGSCPSDGSGESLRTEWAPAGDPSSSGQHFCAPTSSGASLLWDLSCPCLHGY